MSNTNTLETPVLDLLVNQVDFSDATTADLQQAIEFIQQHLPKQVAGGKTIQVTWTESLDLAVPSQRDKWFSSLDSAPQFKAAREGLTFIGRLYVADVLVAEIKSTDSGQAAFFLAVAQAYPIWKKKQGVQVAGVPAAGRLPEAKIRELAMFGLTSEEIAGAIGREHGVVAEWMTKNSVGAN